MPEASLDQVLARAPKGLPVPVGCWVVARVAEALASAPRSVTPREVRVGELGEVRLAPPRPGPTPYAYLAPEVVRGGDPDARSAVFGLGALLVELLTGASPFARASEMETRLAVVEETPPALLGRVPDASGELDAIVRRALEKSPDGRFASTSELAARIDAFLTDELHDIGGDGVAAVVRTILAGGSAEDALVPTFASAAYGGVPVGEARVRLPAEMPARLTPPEPARRLTPSPGSLPAAAAARARPTPAPGIVQPAARRPTPGPGILQPARRPTPGPGIVQPARRPTPNPGIVQPARRPTPGPGIVQPARRPTPGTAPAGPEPLDPRSSPPSPQPGAPSPQPGAPNLQARPSPVLPTYDDAELDLSPDTGRISSPTKPKLDTGVDRIGDPLRDQHDLGHELGQDLAGRHRPRPVALAIDEDALRKERRRPATVAPSEEDDLEDSPRSWLKPLLSIALGLLALAIAYQFLLRPLLR